MRAPQITITCDCGAVGRVDYGDRWACEQCGRTWDTSQIPREQYLGLLRTVRRYRALTLGPPLVLAAVLLPLAVFVGVQFGFLLFVLVLAHALLVLPHLKRRATRAVRGDAPQWRLRPEKPAGT